MQLKIATGQSRKSKKWKNIELSWEELLERLKSPTVTQETEAEYHKLSKAQKAEIKDVGGFVGGWLKKGQRKAGHVEVRSLLTLDVDNASAELLDSLDLIFSWLGAAYSTHSHTADNPRYRLLFPLSREVSADEYQAIGRHIASQIGMAQFDPTSFQPERLMYWPSHARGADYVVETFGQDVINADEVLAEYPDWTDASYWPLHPNESEAHVASDKQLENPLDKTGWIGAFCRAYSVSEAIQAFLSDTYTQGSKADRFSYVDGSTSDGLVVYDDLYAYSHHGTDPISGRAVNAFDLVRIHRFGELDSDREDIKPTNRKSYKEMLKLLQADQATLTKLGEMAMENAQDDFADLDEADDERVSENTEKGPNFRFTEHGTLKNDPYNLEQILIYSAEFKDKLGFNEFTGTFEKLESMPWDVQFESAWTDADTSQFKSYINNKYQVLFGDDRIYDSLVVVSKRKAFNPVKDYIRSEEWDGIPRVGDVFKDYLGAQDNSYVKEVTELWFAAAVSRIYNPGCKFDNVPVLEGAQGIGKSTLIAKLGGEWFTDSLQKLDGNKDDLQILGQSWLVELGELASMNRTNLEQAKGFISRTSDLYRPAYGRLAINQKRHVVFIGTTNSSEFLKDATGNRRWYPISCNSSDRVKSVFDGSLDENVGQLWAEAYDLYTTRYKYGNALVMSNENEKLANEARQAAEAPDVTKDLVIDYLNTPKPKNWHEMTLQEQQEFYEDSTGNSIFSDHKPEDLVLQDFVSSREIYDVVYGTYELKIPGKTSQANSEIRKLGLVLNNLQGWEQDVRRIKGKLARGYKNLELLKAD